MSPAAAIGGKRSTAPIPRLALTRHEAATALGMGVTSFEQYLQPHVRAVRQGKLRLFPIRELERWLDENAAMTFERPPERYAQRGLAARRRTCRGGAIPACPRDNCTTSAWLRERGSHGM